MYGMTSLIHPIHLMKAQRRDIHMDISRQCMDGWIAKHDLFHQVSHKGVSHYPLPRPVTGHYANGAFCRLVIEIWLYWT